MLLIENGTIYAMNGKVYYGGSVLIADGKIIAVGEDIPVPTNEKIERINAKGNLVMPGLIEAHCHMGITEQKKGVEGDDCNEGVNPIMPTLRAIDAINCMDAAFEDAVKAGITSAMIGPGSANVVGGQFAFVKTRGRRIDDLIVKAPAAMKVAFGENPKANYGEKGKSPATRMAIAEMLRKELWKAKEYQRKKQTAEEKQQEFEQDFHYESWLPVLEKRIPIKAHVHRVDDIFTAIRIGQEFDIRITLDHCSEGHLIAKEIRETNYPAIVGPDLTSRNKIEVQNIAFKTAGILEKEGVLLAITTDHPVSLIQTLPLCAGLAVKAGLSMAEGYRAITINPAKICGVDDRVGSLEVGKDADIVIFSGNPMKIFTRTLCTIIDGQVVYHDRDAFPL